MVVDKTLEIDLTELNPQTIANLDSQVEEIKNSFVNPDQRSILEKTTQFPPKATREKGLRRVFGRGTFNNLLSFGTNPLGFLQGSISTLIPFIGAALAISGPIFQLIKRFDDLQKQFVNNIDGRINLFRDKQTQAEIQAGITQLIITSEAGSAEPRDAYNTFEEFNNNQSRIETDFRIRDTSGVD